MIIQCKQCRTKFRFDDSNMQGSGIWLRCSRCGHVYFQENPMANKPVPAPLSEAEPKPEPKPEAAPELKVESKPEPKVESKPVPKPEPKSVEPEKEAAPKEEVSKPSRELPSVIHRDEHGLKHLDKIKAARRRLSDDIDLGVEKKPDEIINEDAEQTGQLQDIEEIAKTEEEITKSLEPEKVKNKKISSQKGISKTFKIAVWSVFVIVILPLLIYFYGLPQFGEQLVNSGQLIVNKFNELRGVPEPPASGAVIIQMVKLQDVRYRRVNNFILGPIGIVEGTALNRAEYPLSRIKIKGAIVDAYSVILGERVSYAGNILTDEELTNLSDEEIAKKLGRPEGLNNSNDRIVPGGQIPFMIVFPSEPAGVIKTTVETVGADRLL